ncbi:2Fe-2S iron-sulfur cluster-binding protein [Solemya velesiana gill symbiont]|uniref:NADH-quinone oxidoreductase subunit G n=1 Tax=Solemya velesiana gill symbiont TaxID=1918948 RepID=A0A1T2KWC9_9GAMM|nr:2Fe-2S iron-sulfur cluster-binding protein [Solemya velesiana gill symbiont]OOZ37122.1 NADP oxidoreductase [Solemya velesiana gill symbiont]
MIRHFTIDGIKVPFQERQTIMDAAMAAGIYIPHLCHNPEFRPQGSCRLCTVKVDGRNLAACTTPATDHAEVKSNTKKLMAMRRTLLQLLFVEGNHVCPACEKSGACQLQAVAYYCGMLAPEFTHFYPQREVDASHPEFAIDFNRCILCELCVRASRDADQKSVFAISGRGIHVHLTVNSPSGKLGDSDFDKHDRAAHVCPVGAILPKHTGYDVPIGKRLYDRKPVSMVGDVSDHEED